MAPRFTSSTSLLRLHIFRLFIVIHSRICSGSGDLSSKVAPISTRRSESGPSGNWATDERLGHGPTGEL
jgi:hypothetical protein